MDISVIILTYNVKKLLDRCLFSLFKALDYAKLNSEVYIVDNGNDGSDELVKDKYKNIGYIKPEGNIGFAKGNNIALKKAKGKYILLLNPDTYLDKGAIKTIYDYMEKDQEAAITTCRVELPDGKLDGACHRAFPTPVNAFFRFMHISRLFPTSKFFNSYNLGYLDISSIHEVDCISGAFMFVRKSAVDGDANHDKVGILDEDYWANGEDIDWCYRFKQKGWKIMYVPLTKVIHYKGASSGIQMSSQDVTTADVATKRAWINSFYNAMPIFYKKHYNMKYPFFVRWIVLLGVEIKRRIALFRLLNGV